MGSTAQVIVVGGRERALLHAARHRVEELERRWSRFRPESELSRLNAGASAVPHVVSADTFLLVERAVRGWELTHGRYDPTVLPALRGTGYDRDFALVSRADEAAPSPRQRPAPGCARIGLDPVVCSVSLPAGVEIDPGGIGKGLAADLVTAELLAAGARGALVNLGGDLRVRGEPPEGNTWAIRVSDPFDDDPCGDGTELFGLGLADGAVATSTSRRRWWVRDGRVRHHLIDPRRGDAASSELVAVTVVAQDGWWAEVAAKAIFVAGTKASQVTLDGVLAATVTAIGTLEMSDALARVAA